MENQRVWAPRGILGAAVCAALAFAVPELAMADKMWSKGADINDPTISLPAAGANFGMLSVVECICNTPTDSDDWVDGYEQGSEPDTAVKATWNDGGAGGTWVDGKSTGSPVKYITPNGVGDVTLTVTFDDDGTLQHNDDPRSTNVTIHVVNAKMIFKVAGNEADSITRAQTGSFEVVDKDGNEIAGATYAEWDFWGEVTVDGTHTSRTWSGQIVEPGYADCDVTFGGTTATVSKLITVEARGWSITPDCDQDAHPGWGDYPGAVSFGRNRDAAQHVAAIIWPRSPWTAGYTTARVDAGPNNGVWYVSASTFCINRETVINQHIKPDSQPEDPPGVKWHEYNEGKGVDADGFEEGVRGHEAYGRNNNGKGHQKQLEDEESKADPQRDAKAAIEGIVEDDEDMLVLKASAKVAGIDEAIFNATAPEPSGNWAGKVWEYLAGQWYEVDQSP